MSKKKIDLYSQCNFVLEGTGNSQISTMAYIDASEAKVGARMTLKGKEGIWQIKSAGQPQPKPRHARLDSMD